MPNPETPTPDRPQTAADTDMTATEKMAAALQWLRDKSLFSEGDYRAHVIREALAAYEAEQAARRRFKVVLEPHGTGTYSYRASLCGIDGAPIRTGHGAVEAFWSNRVGAVKDLASIALAMLPSADYMDALLAVHAALSDLDGAKGQEEGCGG